MFTQERFTTMFKWLGTTAVDNTADNIVVGGRDITFVCVSGNIWINPSTTAVANTTAFPLTAGDAIDINVTGNLSIISDGAGATYKYIIWG